MRDWIVELGMLDYNLSDMRKIVGDLEKCSRYQLHHTINNKGDLQLNEKIEICPFLKRQI